MVDEKVLRFGVVGLANGLAVMADEGTRTLWDHITGEAFYGELEGHQLESWPIRMTTVDAVMMEDPKRLLASSTYGGLFARVMKRVSGNRIGGKGFLPPPFYATMHSAIDARLPKLEQGLGVIVGGKARFYPMASIPIDGIEDEWDGRLMKIGKGKIDRVPFATWVDDEEKPMQLLSRWYGFSFTFPSCDVFTTPR